ncbi:hypothetical protein CerSpe_154260 [Prunus speciosa]
MVDLNEILQGWVIVGFSAATGSWTALHKINSWSFNSTSLNVEKAENFPSGYGINIGHVIGIIITGFILVCFLGLGVYNSIKKKATRTTDGNPNDLIHEVEGNSLKRFPYNELVLATRNFSEGEKLGEGGSGVVYKGYIIYPKSYVAVKKISRGPKHGIDEYAAQLRIISQCRHRNLVQLIGWCHEKGELLLVYEFVPNGSLDSHLFKPESLLSWELRYKIVQGLASGLLYLHEEGEHTLLHGNIKSSNVMLDSNFNAKLGDFGLARLVDHGKQSQTTILAGTMGYMAPDYLNTGKASKESDVYSFGVVALEIACGRKPIDPKFGSSKVNMVEWVWELYGEDRVNEAADPKLCGDFDKKQMECLMIVGLWCAHPDYNMRPSIQQAIQVLNFEVPLPNLPSKMRTTASPTISVSGSSSSIGSGGQVDSGPDYITYYPLFLESSPTNPPRVRRVRKLGMLLSRMLPW